MKVMLRAIFLAAFTAAILPAAAITALDPPGANLTALPGQTVTWQMEVSNDTAWYLVPLAFNYDTPDSVGTLTDVFGPPTYLFLVVAPGGTGQFQGPYEVDPFVPAGTLSTGSLVLAFSLFTVDPNDPEFNPDTDTYLDFGAMDTPASVQILDAAIPEPASSVTLALGLAALAAGVLAKRRSGR